VGAKTIHHIKENGSAPVYSKDMKPSVRASRTPTLELSWLAAAEIRLCGYGKASFPSSLVHSLNLTRSKYIRIPISSAWVSSWSIVKM